jgi:hypothetical protein
MKKKNAKIAILVVALVSASAALLLADEGYQAAGQSESQDVSNNCPNGGCTMKSWTHYGCVDSGSGSCTPYDDPNPAPVVSGSCSLQGGVYYCLASS